ncbi:MAG: hypothetical protein RR623_07935 [Bacilli bacterium]
MSLQLFNLSGAKVSEVSEVKDCEYGSNANGEYWKYANGLIIQFINKSIVFPCATPYGGYFISDNIKKDIPYRIRTCIYKNASFQSQGGAMFANEVFVNLDEMRLNFRLTNGISWGGCNGTISAIIVGTWK